MPRFAEGLIDIFDCSNVEFFVDDEPLSTETTRIGPKAKQKFVGTLDLNSLDGTGGETDEAGNS